MDEWEMDSWEYLWWLNAQYPLNISSHIVNNRSTKTLSPSVHGLSAALIDEINSQ